MRTSLLAGSLEVARLGSYAGLSPDESLGPSAAYHMGKREQAANVIRVCSMRRPEADMLQGPDSSRILWKEAFQDAIHWKDNEPDKRYSTETDFGDAAAGADNWLKPGNGIGTLEADKSASSADGAPAPAENGVELSGSQERADRLWRKYFEDPNDWWDNRNIKVNPKSPDFWHKSSKEALRIDSWHTPQWVTEALKKQVPPANIAGGHSHIGPPSGSKTESVVDSRLCERNEVSWTRLISLLSKSGQGKQALKMYVEMQKCGLKPSSFTIVAVLRACSTLKDLKSTKKVHMDVVQCGLESDVYVGTMLVDVYAKCGSLGDARQVFEKMPRRNVVSWNAVTLAYAQAGQAQEALHLYARMQQEGVVPDDRSFLGALKACSSLAAMDKGKEGDGVIEKKQCLEQVRLIHAQVLNSGFELDVLVGSALLGLYAKCGSLGDARCVFEKMPRRNVVSWTTMILGYAQIEKGEVALQLYARMQSEGVKPDAAAFVGALKACSSIAASEERSQAEAITVKRRCLEQVRAIHSQIVKSGVESAIIVGTMLVDAYAKCGSLVDARHMFDRMPHRNVISWNALILGHAQMGESEEALQLYGLMQQDDVAPDDRTFVGALKACSGLATSGAGTEADCERWKMRCLETVKTIHSDVVKSDPHLSSFVGSILVTAYAKGGSLLDAKIAFERMPHPTIVLWNAMLFGYVEMERADEAMDLYLQMQEEGVLPDDRTFIGVLKACRSLAESGDETSVGGTLVKGLALAQAKTIHSYMLGSGSISDVYVWTILVDVYTKCGSIADARQAFEDMPHRNVVSWNVIISGYIQMELGKEALGLYARMIQEDVTPDDLTFVCALKACGSLAAVEDTSEVGGVPMRTRCLEKVKAIHFYVANVGCEQAGFVNTMLVDMYAKCGSLVDARHGFEKMQNRDVVAWTSMIVGYAQMDQGDVALQLYAQMRAEGFTPNARTFVGALKACSSLASSEEGNKGNRTHGKNWCLDQLRAIHADIEKGEFESDIYVGNMLVDAYAKCGSIVEARCVFKSMPHRDVVTWNAMIMGCAQMDEPEEALKLFVQMQKFGVTPDERTFVGALKACGKVASLEKGKEVHAHIVRSGLKLGDSHVASSLIDMYCKCGSTSDAQRVFDALPSRDIVTWSALIAGYSRLGESAAVFDQFERAKQEGLQPNSVTFLSVLTVCSHVGLVDKGHEYFDAMRRDYGITPTLEHYTCMIDLLGRAGQVHRAMTMAETVKPDGVLWRSVLGACRKWKNVELGRQAFDRAVLLDNHDAAAYILMQNIYSSSHMLEKRKEIQAMRLRSRAWKKPGRSSWTDLSGVVHSFVVGERQHPESPDIHAKVEDLVARMKEKGYTPHLDSVLRDIPEDEKVDALCGHSEKLAIAYALLRTPKGTAIRIVKNLRVCEDCHTATALISEIEERTIICRDTYRFHVFKDGKCSCGNYW